MLQLLRVMPFVLVLATVWIVSSELPNGAVTGKLFWFYGVIVLSSIFIFICCLFERKAFRFVWHDFLVFLFCLSGLVVTWSNSGSFSNKWVVLLLILPLYFCFRYTLQDNRKSRQLLLIFLLITGFVEALWGLGQLYGFSHSFHNQFPVTGSFFNPGPYAGYLAFVAPVAVYYSIRDSRVLHRSFNICYLPFYLRGLISMLTIVSILVILPSTMSRAAWLASACGCLLALSLYFYKNRKAKKNFEKFVCLIAGKWKYVFVFATVFLILGAYFLKKDSADGRFLIWKISTRALTQHPYGVGLGHFAGSYGDCQAAYFASGAGSKQERYVAGSPDYAFNEFLQIGVESGIHGLLLFTAIICFAFYMGIKSKRYAEIGSLGALLVFSSMSYPFSVLPFVIVFVFLLASFVPENRPAVSEKKKCKHATIVCFFLLSAIAVAGSYSRIPTYHAYKKLNTVFMLKIGGLHNEALSLYAEIYPELKHERHYVFDYATLLNEDGQYDKSNHVLRQGMRISCDPVYYNLSGINYQLMKDYEPAESCFRKAADLVPNRLYPYYLLAKLYLEKELYDQAVEMARIVLTKEPKVHSQAVDDMREEMRKLISDMNEYAF